MAERSAAYLTAPRYRLPPNGGSHKLSQISVLCGPAEAAVSMPRGKVVKGLDGDIASAYDGANYPLEDYAMASLSRDTLVQLVVSAFMWLVQPQLLAGYMAALGAIVLGIYDEMPKAAVFGIALWTFAGGLIIAKQFWSWRPIEASKARPYQRESPPAPMPASVHPGIPTAVPEALMMRPQKTIVNADPRYLVDLFAQHTDIQGDELVKTYIGKWMKVSGSFENVSAHGSLFSVDIVNASYDRISLVLWFDAEWMERLSILRPKESIAVVGQINVVGRHRVVLRHCELVS